MGKHDQQDHNAAQGANTPTGAIPHAPVFAVEDLGNDDFKYILEFCGDEVIDPAHQGVYSKTGGGTLQRRFNHAYNQGGEPGSGPNQYADYSAGLMPIEGLAQAGVTWPEGMTFYSPPQAVREFVAAWKAWEALYGKGHRAQLVVAQGLVEAANVARAAMGKKPMRAQGGGHD